MMVPDRFYEKFDGRELQLKHRDVGKEDVMMTRAALAMCENIDWNVGRVLQKLDELKLEDNTMVIYFSDNGPNSFRFNGGMKGKKGSIDEGGLRSPFFIRWPGKIPAGKHSLSEIAGAIDLLPTLTDLAGIKSADQQVHRRSEPPAVADSTQTPTGNRETCSRSKTTRSAFATRNSGSTPVATSSTSQNDRGQLQDVPAQHPELTQQLFQLAKQHAANMQDPVCDANADRPFAVGYAKSTTLPARDGVEHGTIQRSAKPPNNSFFTHWTDVDDSITWDVEILNAGHYEVVVYYTCAAAGDEGATVQLSMEHGNSVAETHHRAI